VGQQEPAIENRGFGRYLRRVRENRKLSLDAVEEMSLGFPGRITKSHLSRIENGQAIPTFPRMFALSRIYGVPISSLAERFEIDLRRSMLSLELGDRSYADLTQELSSLKMSGRYSEALTLCDAVLEEDPAPDRIDRCQHNQLTLERINCLVHLSRYAAAKDECEDILSNADLEPRQRIVALECFAMCCYRLSKFTFAMMALERAQDELVQATDIADAIKLRAYLSILKGNLFAVTGRFQDAVVAFSRAMKEFEAALVPFEGCRARINLAYALIELGKFSQARRSLKNALQEAERQGYDRQIALALSHLALLAYREEAFDNAEALCLRSNSVARPREFISVVFRNCYYLWKIALGREDATGAKIYERSLRHYLNRVEEFLPEAAAYRAHLTGNDVSTAGGEK